MPTLNASTTAVFDAVGISASEIYTTMTSLIGTSVSFGLWLIKVSWPFLLAIGFLYLMVRLARKFLGVGR